MMFSSSCSYLLIWSSFLHLALSHLLGPQLLPTLKPRGATSATCKSFPGDASWPSDAIWDKLNKTTNGALIKTLPLAVPCYPGPLYNANGCTYVTAQWTNASLHAQDPASIMNPIYIGNTCEPPTIFPPASGNCTLGGLPYYTLNATSISIIQAGVNFARENNVRIVIKNTGHDFSGKSAGAGALGIWTHWLKSIEYIPNYEEDGGDWYKGPAFKAGSGVQSGELYEAADAKGLLMVGGEERTVGITGGYILGGGHSPLTSIFGIAADHILSLSLVLASGECVTACSSQNTELFWALRGGGGSTFGIVTSITIKAHPTIPVTATGSIIFGGPGSNFTTEQFWAGIRSFFSYFVPFTQAGTYSYFFIAPGSDPAPPILILNSFFAPNKTTAETQALLAPWLSDLAANNIVVTPQYTTYPTFLTGWEATFPQEAVGIDSSIFGSRLFPRQNWDNETIFNTTFSAWKASSEAGFSLIAFNLSPPPNHPDNAVNPAWRSTVLHSMQMFSWAKNSTVAEIQGFQALLAERMEAWKAVTPGAGSYLGESDRAEVGFEQSFYGDFYPRLLKVKKEVDPGDVFWAKTAVGSEGWEVVSPDVVPDENGRLCRV